MGYISIFFCHSWMSQSFETRQRQNQGLLYEHCCQWVINPVIHLFPSLTT